METLKLIMKEYLSLEGESTPQGKYFNIGQMIKTKKHFCVPL